MHFKPRAALVFLANNGATVLLLGIFAAGPNPLFAQAVSQTEPPAKPMPGSVGQQDRQSPSVPHPPSPQSDPRKDAPLPTEGASALNANSPTAGKQPKRILWIIPNFRAVSANSQLPPLSPKGKLRLATQDSFDYSSFLMAGIVAGWSQARNSTPAFQHGASAYGRYYCHSFADQTLGNYLTEAILPIATRQDPRYYTLGPGNGSFGHRTLYALSRIGQSLPLPDDPPSQDRDVSWKLLVPNTLHDQKKIWFFPTEVVRAHQ
jgi:hypothetical protein